jgi:DNA-binding CsgD family transcriptional regulator
MNSHDESSEPLHRLGGLLRRSSARRAIVHLLLDGCTRKQIALELKRSQHTIDAHLKTIYREVGVGDRARLMLLAIRLRDCGELPPPPRNWVIARASAMPNSVGAEGSRSGLRLRSIRSFDAIRSCGDSAWPWNKSSSCPAQSTVLPLLLTSSEITSGASSSPSLASAFMPFTTWFRCARGALLATVCLCAGVACGEGDVRRSVRLASVELLESERIHSSSPQLPIAASRSSDTLVYFDLNSRTLQLRVSRQREVEQLGRIGSGPGEFRLVVATSIQNGVVLLLDPQLRRVVEVGRNATRPSAALGVGGHRAILEWSDSLRVLGGAYSLRSAPDKRYALVTYGRDGQPHFDLPFEVPAEPSARRSFGLLVAPCGPSTAVVGRTDSLDLRIVDIRSGRVLERIDLPIAHAEFDTERDMLSPDSGQIMTGQRLVQAVGGSTGCVVQTARRRARPDSARFVLSVESARELDAV